jgi:hypothetical protein
VDRPLADASHPAHLLVHPAHPWNNGLSSSSDPAHVAGRLPVVDLWRPASPLRPQARPWRSEPPSRVGPSAPSLRLAAAPGPQSAHRGGRHGGRRVCGPPLATDLGSARGRWARRTRRDALRRGSLAGRPFCGEPMRAGSVL